MSKFNNFVWHWLKKLVNFPNSQRYPKYIEAKASQIISIAIVRYYPKYWPTAFEDLMTFMKDSFGKFWIIVFLIVR